LNAGTVYADGAEFQTAQYSYRHAMKKAGQSVEIAKMRADRFVREQYSKARELWSQGKEYDAYFQLGVGLHVLQDATSPAHGGFQEWNGDENIFELIKHVFKELKYPGKDSNLQNVTNQFLDWFENNEELPKGNLFDTIQND
jgi:hypothetical protein